jgi:ElaB/YqjD/DUF883 family membrane-anchored ribosome-binding protein
MSDTPVEAPGPNATAAEANAAVANAASAIGASVAGVAQIIALAERDPCNYEARLFDRLRVAQANLDAMITGVRVWSAKNQAAVERSISTWGKDPLGDDLGGSVAFSDYLAANGYIEPFWALFVSTRLPNGAGDNEPSRVNSGAYFIGGPVDGYLGRPGAYVSSRGEIRGSGINEAWHNWTQLQRENVWAASTFRPNWRERLEAWTGRRDWKPGNKFRSGYTVATAIQRVNELENQFDSIAARCEELLATQLELAEQESERASAWVQGQIDAARQQTQVQADAAELASIEELDRQKTIRTVGVAAALGLAAVVAFR